MRPEAPSSLDTQVIVYCDCPSEYSVVKVARSLQRAGFTSVRPCTAASKFGLQRANRLSAPISALIGRPLPLLKRSMEHEMRPDSLSTSRTPDLVASERDAGRRHDALIAEPRLIQKSKKYLVRARSRYGPTARAWPMPGSTQTEFLRGANLQDQNS